MDDGIQLRSFFQVRQIARARVKRTWLPRSERSQLVDGIDTARIARQTSKVNWPDDRQNGARTKRLSILLRRRG